MLEIVPNINLNGNCEEAVHAYMTAFDAKLGCMLRYSDADERDWSRPLTPEERSRIYHCELTIGSQRVIMSDNLDMSMTDGLKLSLTVFFDCKADVLRAYDALREGSHIIYPIHSTTYSACEVVFTDRFGIRWGLMSKTA